MRTFYCLLVSIVMLAIAAFCFSYSFKNTPEIPVQPGMHIIYDSMMADNDDEFEDDLVDAFPEEAISAS